MTGQNEIWWFYPSVNSLENDKYIVFNYLENLWYYGSLSRTAIIDASSTVRIYPQAAAPDGYLYDQERGLDDGSTTPATGVASFIESSDFDIGEGDRFMLTQRIIPDLTFNGSTAVSPSGLAIMIRPFILPMAPQEYDPSYMNQLTRALEVLINQVENPLTNIPNIASVSQLASLQIGDVYKDASGFVKIKTS